MFKSLFILFLYLIPTFAIAQHKPVLGYLISWQNDTIPGHMLIQSDFHNAHAIHFIDPITAQPKQYTPEEIKGYVLGSEYYASQDFTTSFPGEKLFGKQILRGHASVYVTYPKAGKPMYVLQKKEGNPIPLEERKYIGLLTYYLGDCPAMGIAQSKPGSISYSAFSMTKIITQYNRCISPQTSQTIHKRKLQVNYGPMIGANINHYRLIFGDDKYSAKGDYGWNNSPTVGAFFGISAGRKIDIELQALYNYSTGQFIRHRDNNYYKDQIFSFKAHYLNIPLLFRFYFLNKIYLSPGLNLICRLSQHGKETFMENTYPFAPHPDLMNQGMLLGAGAKIKLFTRVTLIEARINSTTITDGANEMAKLTSYQFLLRTNINKLKKTEI